MEKPSVNRSHKFE
nr:hypothetical protein [Streptococcus oralis]MBU6872849.1 hypothetical protein [Streptococcus oralis]